MAADGDGAGWLLDRTERLLGLTDDVTGFDPATRPLAELWRRHRGDRVPRTGTLWHDLAFSVVQQRVTRQDGAEQWRRLVTALGTPAPGAPGLTAPPAPAVVARLPYDTFHRFGIERRRADALRAAALAAVRLQATVDDAVDSAVSALRSVPKIGPWTASCLATTTWGDADAVVVGDSGIPSMVTWLLAGEHRGSDARMLDLLEPYRPHRYRVVRLVFRSGTQPPRRHPRGARHDVRRR